MNAVSVDLFLKIYYKYVYNVYLFLYNVGDKCPGLDLHFWRKVCRNCKCRKDQHSCTDDDLSGWAQFEILGQIRSKPACM